MNMTIEEAYTDASIALMSAEWYRELCTLRGDDLAIADRAVSDAQLRLNALAEHVEPPLDLEEKTDTHFQRHLDAIEGAIPHFQMFADDPKLAALINPDEDLAMALWNLGMMNQMRDSLLVVWTPGGEI